MKILDRGALMRDGKRTIETHPSERMRTDAIIFARHEEKLEERSDNDLRPTLIT